MTGRNPAKRRATSLRAFRFRLLGVVLVAVLGVAAAAAGIAGEGRNAGMTVVAQFDDVSPVIVGNEVKVSGVQVGEVTSMSVQGGKANVALSLRPEALPVHDDASVKVRPISLLGERFLELKRGSPQAPALRPGAIIPATRTDQNTDLDEVLNTVDDPTGQSLAALVTMLGQGAQGNGANADATIRALASSMNKTDQLALILSEQNGVLNNVVDKVDPVARSLARDDGRTLDGLVGSAHDLLGSTSTNSEALRQSLGTLPGTLETARTTLAQLTGTAQATTPVLESVRPTTDDLDAISTELKQFSDSADPALASAQPVLGKAQDLLDEARPVAADLRTAGPDLRSVAGSGEPIVRDLTGNLGNVLGFVRNWALANNGSDGVSHYLRVMLNVNADVATGVLPGAPAPPGAVPEPGAAPPGLPHLPSPPSLPKLPGIQGPLPGGLLSPEPAPDGQGGGVTGLDQQQESGALRFLIGGQ